MKWPPVALLAMAVSVLAAARVPVQAAQAPPPIEQSPSQQKIQWTQSKTSQEFLAEYDYVGGAKSDIGTAGEQAWVSEHYAQVRQIVTRRCLRAFLVHGGIDWQHFGFYPPTSALLPDQLEVVSAFFGVDFRWSRKDLFIVRVHPGYYSDLKDVTSDFNAPLDLAYTRIVSNKFQWVLGLSINTLRDVAILPGGGFRVQLTDRWKLKLMLPEPQVEYKARDDLHVFVGGDLRGDAFRVGKHFGDDHGLPSLNNALVDYREIRVGAGFSWNIKPMIELNMESGYLVDRQFSYHNNGIVLRGGGAPYASLNVHVLFELWAPQEEKEYNERIEIDRQLQVPIEQQELKQLFK